MEIVSDVLIRNTCLINDENVILAEFSKAIKSIETCESAVQSSDVIQQSTSPTEFSNCQSDITGQLTVNIIHHKLLVLSNLDLLASRCSSGCNTARWILKSLIQEHKLVEILVFCLEGDDAFVAYSSCKTLATLICTLKSQVLIDLPDILLTEPINRLQSIRKTKSSGGDASQMKEKTVHPWDVVTLVLERTCSQEQQQVKICCQKRTCSQEQQQIKVCCQNHPSIHTAHKTDFIRCCCTRLLQLLEKPEDYKSILLLVEKDVLHENCLMSILLLIEASLKYATMNLNGNMIEHLKNSERFFVDTTESLHKSSNPLIYRKILDILHNYLVGLNYRKELHRTLILSTKLLSFSEMFERVPYRDEYIAFGGSIFSNYSNLDMEYQRGDLELLRKLALLVAKNCEVIFKTSSLMHLQRDATESFNKLSIFLNSKLGFTSETICDWLFHLYADNDASLICIMFVLLRINKICRSTNMKHNPHEIFNRFLKTVGYDYSVLLDLLISNETEFLPYFVEYLHVIIAEWSLFKMYYSSLQITDEAFNEKKALVSGTMEITTSRKDFRNVLKRVDEAVDLERTKEGKRQKCFDNYQREGVSKNCQFKDGDTICCEQKRTAIDTVHQYTGDSSKCHSDQLCDNVEYVDNCVYNVHNEGVDIVGDNSDKNICFNDNVGDDIGREDDDNDEDDNVNQNINFNCTGDLDKKKYDGKDNDNMNDVDNYNVLNDDGHLGQISDVIVEEEEDDVDDSISGEGDGDDHDHDDDVDDGDNHDDGGIGSLDKTMSTLIRLRLAIDRIVKQDLFPFSVVALLKLLENVEYLYEN